MMRNATVLITGGAGFIGANLVRKLLSVGGFEVSVIEKEGTNLWRLSDILYRITFRYADLKDDKSVRQIIQEIQPSIVFHLASYGVDGSVQKDELEMRLVNREGTSKLVLALKEQHVPEIFVFTSTSFVYGPKDGKLTEKDKVVPLNEYAATKYKAEKELQRIAKESGISVINARLFTAYGYYENNKPLIPYIILNALQDKPIELSSPDNVRDFIFIEDVLDLFMKMIETKQNYQGEVFNVGSGKQHRIADIVDAIEKAMNKKLPVSYGRRSSPYQEPKVFVADNTKAKETFGWEPKYDLESGIEKNVAWFERHKKLYREI
mgnify:CR=1 FL=1